MRWIVGLTEYAGLTAYTGGIGTHYAALLPALAGLGIDVDVVLFAPREGGNGSRGVNGSVKVIDGAGGSAGAARVVAWHDLGRLPLPAQLPVRAALFRRHVGRERYDAVFLPEWGGLAALLPPGAPLVTNLATGIRLGDWIAGRRARDFPAALRPGRWLQHALETRQIRRSRGIVPISHAVLGWNRRNIAPLPAARVVRNCVDDELISRRAAESPLPDAWPTGAGPIVLFVGRLERRKGVLPAMDAFGTVLQRHPDARLVLAGAGGDARFEPTRNDLLARVPASARERVTFLGHLPGDRLAAAMAGADVVLCPSLWEGFGNVALEAMAAGTPLVATTGSGFVDFCRDGENALMVAPDAAAALAAAVSRILADADLAAGLRAGAFASLPHYAPDAVAADLAQAVRALLRTESPQPSDPAPRLQAGRR